MLDEERVEQLMSALNDGLKVRREQRENTVEFYYGDGECADNEIRMTLIAFDEDRTYEYWSLSDVREYFEMFGEEFFIVGQENMRWIEWNARFDKVTASGYMKVTDRMLKRFSDGLAADGGELVFWFIENEEKINSLEYVDSLGIF